MTPDIGATAVPRTARLRADASRNRERIVSAAREAIVEFGPDVPQDEVARRAGVGNATLYRHFTDRTELIRQAALAVMAGTARRARIALAEESDAVSALCRFVFEAAEERIFPDGLRAPARSVLMGTATALEDLKGGNK